MKLSEALQSVSRIYVPGVAKYYAQLNPDPWQAAHDELENIIGVFDEAKCGPTCERFVSRCSELILRFKQEGRPSKSVSGADAFTMASRESIDAHLSRKLKRCAKCEVKTGLDIYPVLGSDTDVFLLCKQCALKSKAQIGVRA